jgi:O-antigen ligase
MNQILIILTVLFSSVFYWGQDFQGTRAFTFHILANLWLAAFLGKRVHWAAGLAFGWMGFSALYIFAQPVSPLGHFGPLATATFDGVSAISYLSVLSITYLLAFATKEQLESLLVAFATLCFLDALFVLAQWIGGANTSDRGGFFGNTSMNACVIAFTYPLLTRNSRKANGRWSAVARVIKLYVPILAILVSRSNLGLLSLLAAFIAPTLFDLWPEKFSFLGLVESTTTLIFSASGLFLVGHWFMGPKFGDDNGRFQLWSAAINWWLKSADHFFGMGLGTYAVFGPNIQISDLHQMTWHFPWLHNEPLQILFEQGIIGLFLFLNLTYWTFRSCSKTGESWLLSAVSAYFVASLGNYPMHQPVTGFFGVLLVILALGAYAKCEKSEEVKL